MVNIYKEIPKYFKSYTDYLEVFNSEDAKYDFNSDKEEWVDNFTITGAPYILNNDVFIIPRNTKQPYMIDFYSFKRKKYISSINLKNNVFLGSYNNKIYLLKEIIDGNRMLICEMNIKKGIKIPTFGKIQKNNIEIQDTMLNNTKFSQITKEIREAYIKKEIGEYTENISEVSVKKLYLINDKEEYGLLNKINKKKKFHFLVFLRQGINENSDYYFYVNPLLIDFCSRNPDYDYYIIATHPNKNMLKLLEKVKDRNGNNYLINTDPKRIFPLFPNNSLNWWYPFGIVYLIDNEGNILKKIENHSDMMNYDKWILKK